MTILDIAKNELRHIYLTPLAWIVLAVIQFLLTIIFLRSLDQFLLYPSQTSKLGVTIFVIPGTLQTAGLLLLLITPFLTMRLISGERRSGTLTLLLSSPVSITEIVLGKYIGTLLFFLGMLFMISLLPLSLSLGTRLDFGLLATGMIGLVLVVTSMSAIGLFVSTLTKQPAIAAIITFAIIFLFWIFHVMSTTSNEKLSAVINYLSMQRHFNHLLSGIFSSVDVIYYLLLSTVFILLSILRLDAIRRLD